MNNRLFFIVLFSFGILLSLYFANSYALEENGIIEMSFTENPPTIDGRWTTETEWEDASVTSVKGNDHQMYLFVKHDRDFAYLMGDVVTDYYDSFGSSSPKYMMGLYFDTEGSRGIGIDKDDMRFVFGNYYFDSKGENTESSSVAKYDKSLCNSHNTCAECTPSISEYCGWSITAKDGKGECKIGETNEGSKGSKDGEASLAKGNWVWHTSEVTKGNSLGLSCEEVSDIKNNPPTGYKNNGISLGTNKGEFQNISIPSKFEYEIGFSSKNDPYESGRDHRIYEFKIPLDFLHKSDEYGFGIIYWVKFDGKIEETRWPPNMDWNIPLTYGTLESVENSVTLPPVPAMSVSEKSLSFGNTMVSEKTVRKIIISNKGTSILKIENVKVPDGFVILGFKSPYNVESEDSVTFDVVFSPKKIGVKSGNMNILSNDMSFPSYLISLEGKGIEKTDSFVGGGCLIATATYGTELSPQVQKLREIRDNVLLQTQSGTVFLTAFNQFYYSFSPTVADLERESPIFKEAVKITLTPLISSMSVLNYVSMDSEEKILGYGISLIFLNVGMYFVAPAIIISKLKNKWSK